MSMPVSSQTVATQGREVASDEGYVVRHHFHDGLTVSAMELRKGQEAKGQNHDPNGEVRLFFGGARDGMVVGDEKFPASEGADLTSKEKFYKVINESQTAPLRVGFR
jgi:hypothetical protein